MRHYWVFFCYITVTNTYMTDYKSKDGPLLDLGYVEKGGQFLKC